MDKGSRRLALHNKQIIQRKRKQRGGGKWAGQGAMGGEPVLKGTDRRLSKGLAMGE